MEGAEAGAFRLRRYMHAVYGSCMPQVRTPRRARATY
jgi:hypothetical protein